MVIKKNVAKTPLMKRQNRRTSTSSWTLYDTMKNIAGGVFSGVLAYVAAGMLIALFSLFWFGIGYYIVKKYNKENTKLFEDLQPMQYLGISFMVIGVLPYLQYFFIFLMSSAGSSAWEEISDEF